jgi:hypothetical protein
VSDGFVKPAPTLLVIVGSNTFIHFASACFEKDREIIKLEVTTARISSKKKLENAARTVPRPYAIGP